MSKQHERMTVTVHGVASAVLVAPDDLDALQEMIAVLSDSDLLRQLVDSAADIEVGHVESDADPTAAMRRRRAME